MMKSNSRHVLRPGILNERQGQYGEKINQRKFINNIVAFEKGLKNAADITVYEFIGKPEFRKVEELYPDEIILELCTFFKVLEKNNIRLQTLSHYPEETIYRFITDELFEVKMKEIRLPGYWTHFIYEEFHPNHPHDIKRQSEEFIRILFGNDWRFLAAVFSEFVKINGKEYHRNKLDDFYNLFLDRFGNSKVLSTLATISTFDESNAKVFIKVEVNESRYRLNDKHLEIELHLENEHGWWQIKSFRSPVFEKGL